MELSNKRLVFLVGAPRSGTTWLQLMLASSAQVATVNETHLFSLYLVSLFDSWDQFQHGRETGLSHLMKEAEFLSLIRDFASNVISRILATRPEATVVLEKTPDHVRNWRNILKIYPHANFIVLIRDPRGVVASTRAASKGSGSGWAPSDLVEISKLWNMCVKEGQQIGYATNNVIEVRYEDLQADCAAELHHIFAWMGINCSTDECSRIAQRHHIDEIRSRRLDGAPWDLSKEPRDFYRRGEIDSWRIELTRRQVYLVESMTGDLMDSYRYPRIAWSKLAVRVTLGIDRLRTGLKWRLRRIADAL